MNTLVCKGLKVGMPDAYAVLSKFRLSLDDEQAVMMQNQAAGADPAKTAAAWVQANPAAVKAWFG